MNKIDYVVTSTTKYIEQMTKAQRKKYGQFFTSKETAVFMAELFRFLILVLALVFFRLH